MPPHLVVVGSINMDLVARVAQLPRPGETVQGLDFQTSPGGKGANQAVAAARLGARTTMIGRVGDDDLGGRLRASLERYGVDAAGVIATAGCASGVAMIHVAANGENSIVVVPGANGGLSADDIHARAEIIASADGLLLQLETPLDAVLAAAEIARRHGVRTILDPAPAPSSPLPAELYRLDLVTPNQTEAEALTGVRVDDLASAWAAADKILQRGAGSVAIKLGSEGAIYADSGGTRVRAPARPVRVVDTTAAGDAFTAALAVALAEGMDRATALAFACDEGALAATRPGAQGAMPTRAEVDALPPREGDAAARMVE